MGRNLMAQVARYLSSQKRRKLGYWTLCGLGAIVVFCTTYALILPAITMSNEPICGMEAHVHDESCWSLMTVGPERELICEEWQEADIVFHTHDSFCYNGEGGLICPLEEREQHVHGEDCSAEERVLICELEGVDGEALAADAGLAPESQPEPEAEPQPGIEPHVHTEECYLVEQGELICGQEEIEGHWHSEECYADIPTGQYILTCGEEESDVVGYDEFGNFHAEAHRHDDSCYQAEVMHVLDCGLEEIEGHVHTDDCYERTEELVCGLEETEPEEGEFQDYQEPPQAEESEEEPVHIHTDECYEVTLTQACFEEEYELHTHGPECYETIAVEDGTGGYVTQEVLICELPVVIEHQHAEDCFIVIEIEGGEEQTMVRSCGLEYHEHTDECFLPAGPDPDPYYCGLAEHEHTAEECYFESGELRCTIPEHEHTEECLDRASAPDPEYPLEEPGEEEPGEDGEEPEDPEDGENPEEPGEAEALAPVEINDIYEYVTDEFVMTFQVSGVAMPVRDETDDEPYFDYSVYPSVQEPSAPAAADADDRDAAPVDVLPEPLPDPLPEPEPDPEPEFTSEPEPDPAPEAEQPEAGEAEEPEEGGGQLLSLGMDGEDIPLSPLPAEMTAEPEEYQPEPEITNPEPETDSAPAPVYQPPVYTAVEPESEIEFRVEEVTQGKEYEALMEQMLAVVDEETLIAPIQVMQITAYMDGRPLNLEGCEITVQVRPTQRLAEAASSEAVNAVSVEDGEGEGAEETEASEPAQMSITVLPLGGEAVVRLMDVDAVESAAPIATTFTARSNTVMYAAGSNQSVNPKFTVQFYANLNVPESSTGTSNTTIPFINTSKATGLGKLPANGNTSPNLISLGLNKDGTVVFKTAATKVYKDETREFNPKLSDDFDVNYLNSLRDNTHYQIKALWVLKAGKDPASKTAGDWETYPVTNGEAPVAFTNNGDLAGQKDEKGRTYIFIETDKDKPSTVIRLVYDPASATETFKSTFYDYDISKGPKTAATMYTQHYGINSYLPYTGKTQSGNARYAFGNVNMNTDAESDKWNGSNINRYNWNSEGHNYGKSTYQGLSLGLVSGMKTNKDGSFDVTFSGGITGPSIGVFGNTSGTGKIIYPNWNLDFTRAGDTFTLSTVSMSDGTKVATGLTKFSHPGKWNGTNGYRIIWTNNFWPLDAKWKSQSNILDPMFGGTTIPKVDGKTKDNGDTPPSDDDIDHNSYFGMTYQVEFDLVEEYVGPLEYYFYGDDDMWVFLDGETLVCDIGGVHSSVGEYVDLWDYIPGGREGHGKGQHSLTVFYTERGASGSSCWMQFTLPQISQIYNKPYDPTSAGLTVEKVSKGADEDVKNTEFPFSIKLGNIYNEYAYSIVDSEGTPLGKLLRTDKDKANSTVTTVSAGTYYFDLKAGEKLEIIALPIGTTYWVEEMYTDASCSTSVSVNGGQAEQTLIAQGTLTGKVVDGKDDVAAVTVTYTNTFLYTLPSTGGLSAVMYTIGGTLLTSGAAGSLLYRKRTKRRGADDRT